MPTHAPSSRRRFQRLKKDKEGYEAYKKTRRENYQKKKNND